MVKLLSLFGTILTTSDMNKKSSYESNYKPTILALATFFKVASWSGIFPFTVPATNYGNILNTIYISKPTRKIYIYINHICSFVYAALVALQLIPLTLYLLSGNVKTITVLETLCWIYMFITSFVVFIHWNFILDSGKFMKLANDWAKIELDIIGKSENAMLH